MRTTFLAVFLVLVAGCATADQIGDLVTNLPDGWNLGLAPIVPLPKTASTEQVLHAVFQVRLTGDGLITNYTVLKARQVTLAGVHHPGARKDSYTAVLVQTGHSEKIVLFRYDDFSKGWWSSRIYDAKPSA
jgi:hypothetical protein